MDILVFVLGLGLCIFAWHALAKHHEKKRAEALDHFVNVVRKIGTDEINKLHKELEVDWACEESKYEVKH